MKQLIYRSEPFGFDRSTLAGILMDARHHNRRNDITGALICRDDLYIQLIEGPEIALDATYARISRDDRHCNIRLLFTATVEERMFPGWDMFHDEMPTLTWTPAEVQAGAIDAASLEELHAVFARAEANALASGDARS